MKGIVFTEFLELVEEKFGLKMADYIVSNSELASNGVYTAVGTYDYKEIFTLVQILSKEVNIETSELMIIYGKHFFKRLMFHYPTFFEGQSLFSLLGSIDNHIHVEVQKLYPDAELPKFEHEFINDKHMRLTYTSERKMSDFAEGLVLSAMGHFNIQGSMNSKVLDKSGKVVEFEIVIDE